MTKHISGTTLVDSLKHAFSKVATQKSEQAKIAELEKEIKNLQDKLDELSNRFVFKNGNVKAEFSNASSYPNQYAMFNMIFNDGNKYGMYIDPDNRLLRIINWQNRSKDFVLKQAAIASSSSIELEGPGEMI